MHAPTINTHRPARFRAHRGRRGRRSLPLIFVTCFAVGATFAAVGIGAALFSHMPRGGLFSSSATLGDLMTRLRNDHDLSAYGMSATLPAFLLPPHATAGVSFDESTTIDGAFVAFRAYEFSDTGAAADYAALAGGIAGGRLVLQVGTDYGGGDELATVFEAVTR